MGEVYGFLSNNKEKLIGSLEFFLFSTLPTLDNAIPIKSWFSDPSDTALLNLLPMLDALR